MNTGLGMSLTGFYSDTYGNYLTALTADKQIANGGDGNTAFLSNLPAGGNPVPGNSTSGVRFTSAQGRVLGFNTPGDITVNNVAYDSQISLNVAAFNGNADALASTAAHEINEALGLGSALDGPVQVQDAFGPVTATPQMAYPEFEGLNDIGYNRAPVPEASTTVSFGLLLALGLGGFVIARKRKAGNTSA